MLYFVMVLMTPSHMVLTSMKVKVKPESFFYSIRNKKKFAGARSGEWGGESDGWQPGWAFSSGAPSKTSVGHQQCRPH
jgi:hypothetical protein